MKKVAAVLLMAMCLATLASCDATRKTEEPEVPVESVTTIDFEQHDQYCHCHSSEDAELTEASTETTPETTPETTIEVTPEMLEYQLVWEENFDGDTLDTDNWNHEIHGPGWVNNELQSYVVSDETVYVEDGELVIQPIRIEGEDGSVTYESGRINTMRHQQFTYGRVEARIQVPEGQGFLPAFWMMPAADMPYGGWPRSGEIDIMEVVGHETNVTHGTIHYGNPHNQNQVTYTLPEGEDFASSYHVFAVEWEPGRITWFVDDIEIGSTSDWFSATEGLEPRTYPAPFNKDFYIILNVAVGGNWPGDPDETTPFDERSQMRVDYVRVYQRGYYDENVERPEAEYYFSEPQEDGNYIYNDNWEFFEAEGGDGSMVNEDGSISISTNDAGTVDYSIQLVNAGLPARDGYTYVVSFEARADEARSAIVAVTAPDSGYVRYLEDETIELDSNWQTYTFEFTMDGVSDDNARLEFNLGNLGSVAGIEIRNVSYLEAAS